MLNLILDTSTDQSLIALVKNDQIISFKAFLHKQNLSQNLLPSIKEILEENNSSLKDLAKISAGIGPGSYTGTRISVAVAQSLSLSLSIPLHPFCSLLAFLPPKLPQGFFTFILHSKQPSWFALKGHLKEGQIQSSLTQQILPKEEILPFIEGVPSLLTFDPSALLDHLSNPLPPNIQLLTAAPNIELLLPYLSKLEKSPPQKPNIIYLHNF